MGLHILNNKAQIQKVGANWRKGKFVVETIDVIGEDMCAISCVFDQDKIVYKIELTLTRICSQSKAMGDHSQLIEKVLDMHD